MIGNTRQNPKILAPNGDNIFLTALAAGRCHPFPRFEESAPAVMVICRFRPSPANFSLAIKWVRAT
jgi:hypothetical protein